MVTGTKGNSSGSLRRADAARYLARHNGRNRVEFATDRLPEQSL
jgi:hypothetical protein